MEVAPKKGTGRRSLLRAAACIPPLLLLLLAAFPWGFVARHAGGTLSKSLGQRVTVGAARRVDWLSFTPAIEMQDLSVSQPSWVGNGEMAHVRALRFQLPIFPLLIGRIHPRGIVAEGLDLNLFRDADGRENWSSGQHGNAHMGGPMLTDLAFRQAHIHLDDMRRHVVLDASLVSDRDHGLRIDGRGTLRGTPMTLAVSAPTLIAADVSKPYPVRMMVRSPLAALDADVTMAHPLDMDHFSGHVAASGQDLGYLDDIIQAGLFRTQPFRLTANIRHDGADWHATRMAATIGRSNLVAKIDVTKPNGRTHLDGQVSAQTLDFDDFASDEQRARASADKQRTGPRVVPDTKIILSRLNFDGRIGISAAQLLSSGSSPFRSLRGTATLDDHRLALSSIVIGLPRGQMTGTAIVDDRGRMPRLSVDLRITGASVETFFPHQQALAGAFRGHVVLAGSGTTVRNALAAGNGKVGVAVSDGNIRRDYATFLGGNVFRSVGAMSQGKQPRTAVDCIVGDFAVRRGRMEPKPLLLSTSVARGDGTGMIVLGPETIDLRVIGRPTKPGLLVSTAPVRLFGTLSAPRIDIRPPRAKDEKQNRFLSRVGFFIKKLRIRGSDDVRPAAAANCQAEMNAALG